MLVHVQYDDPQKVNEPWLKYVARRTSRLCICTLETPSIVNSAGAAPIRLLLFQCYSKVWLLTSF